MKTLAVLLVLLVGCSNSQDRIVIRDLREMIRQRDFKLDACLEREAERSAVGPLTERASDVAFWTYESGYGPVLSISETNPDGWRRNRRLVGKEAVAAMRKWLDANYPEETR